jgi:hypothetical protein
MKHVFACLLLVSMPHTSNAEVPEGSGRTGSFVYVFGNEISCRKWLTESYGVGAVWIAGYWTGRNIDGARTIGHTTDQNGIIAEVRLACEAEPALSLVGAASRVYKRFFQDGR